MVHCRLFFDVLSLILEQVDNRDSFENVSTKWMAEIHENCPGVKMVLTALKCDLRKDEEQNENPDAVTFDEGLAKAKEVGAVKYLGTLCCVVVFFCAALEEFVRADGKQNARPFRIAGFARPSMKPPRWHWK